MVITTSIDEQPHARAAQQMAGRRPVECRDKKVNIYHGGWHIFLASISQLFSSRPVFMDPSDSRRAYQQSQNAFFRFSILSKWTFCAGEAREVFLNLYLHRRPFPPGLSFIPPSLHVGRLFNAAHIFCPIRKLSGGTGR